MDDRVGAKTVLGRSFDFRPMLDLLPVAAYLCGPEGLIVHFNRRAVQLWGREPKLLDPADRFCGSFRRYSSDGAALAPDQCWMALALRDGCEYAERELIVEQPSGERRVAVVNATPYWDEEGRLCGAINVLVDITDLRTAQQARRETERRFSSFMRHLPAAAWVKDAAGRYTYANDYAQRIFATPLDALQGKTDLEVFPLDTAAMFRENDQQVLEGGQAVRRIELLEHDGDGVHESIVTKFPILDEAGTIASVGGVAIDVTEQRRATQALRESEARYRRLAELLPVGLYTCSAPEGTITYFNKEATRIWGRTPAEGDTDERFCGSFRLFRPDGEFLPHEDCPMAVSLRDGIGFRNEEAVVERPDGSRLTVRVNIDPIRDAEGRVIGAVNVFHDTTALQDAQRKVREEKDNLRTLLEALPLAVVIAQDPECSRISGNPAAEQLLRVQPGGNLSKTAPPGEQPAHFRIFQHGRAVPPEELPVQRAARGETIRGEELDLEFDEGALIHAAVSARPLLDATGNPRGAVAALLDITDLKNAENALKEADRRKDEFLATLGHELRNPLAPIRMGLEIMKMAGDDREKLQRTREMMERQTEQLIALVDELLDVSRITRGKIELDKQPVRLADVIQHAVEASRPWLEEAGHDMTVDAPDDGTWVAGDANRLTQIVCNLLNNACKYTPRGGRIWLTARRQGGEVVVSVKDNGIGLPPETAGRIFEMFEQLETPRGVQKSGLGIGLTLVKQLVEMHGGQVEARSEGPGRGSELIVRLPVLTEIAGEEEASEPARASGTERRRVLVADDNRAAADSLSTVIADLGHEVRTAYDGAQALTLAAEFRPHVMMMDLGMPNMDGYEAARQIRRQPWAGGLLLVAVSGWGQERHKSRAAQAGFDHHLVKPIEAEDILRLLTRSDG